MTTIIDDRFPVSVTTPDAVLHRARVILTEPTAEAEGRLYIAVAAGAWLHDVPWRPESSSYGHRAVWFIDTEVGRFEVGLPSGCRCGRLGHWRPFDGGPERRRVGRGRVA